MQGLVGQRVGRGRAVERGPCSVHTVLRTWPLTRWAAGRGLLALVQGRLVRGALSGSMGAPSVLLLAGERCLLWGLPGKRGQAWSSFPFSARVPRPRKGPRTCFRAWDLRFKLGQAHGGDWGLLVPHLTTTPSTGLWEKCPDLVRLAGDGHCVPLLTRVTPRASVSPLQSEGGRVESGRNLTCLPGMGSSQTCAACRHSGCLGP